MAFPGYCKYCGEKFDRKTRHEKVCPECARKNRRMNVVKYWSTKKLKKENGTSRI